MSATSSVLSALAFILSIAACLFAARSAIQVQELRDLLAALPVSQMRSIAASQSSISDRLDDHQRSLADLANRFKMTKVRAATDHVREKSADPDPHSEPDRWREWMNAKLNRRRLGLS